jgi:adenosylhomocysteine nucleosidase
MVRSRIGKVAAASTATTLIDRFGVDAILLTGVAGGLGSNVRIGDVIVASHCVHHDLDLKGLLKCRRGDIPLLGVSMIPADPELLSFAKRAADSLIASTIYAEHLTPFSKAPPQVHCGLLASGDQFVCSHEERQDLLASFPGVLAVEMESAAIAQVCLEHSVPCVATKIISDSADGGATADFGAFVEAVAAMASEALAWSVAHGVLESRRRHQS